jgi:hypothetical protein
LVGDSIVESEIVTFDEDCFIHGSEGRFQIDTLVLIAGKAIVVGVAGLDLADSKLTAKAISSQLNFSEFVSYA